MEIIKKNNYRLCTISTFTKDGFVDNPTSYGLAIERETFYTDAEDNPTYYVICFIKYDEHDESAVVENVGTRLLDIEDSEWPIFRNILKVGSALIEAQNMKVD